MPLDPDNPKEPTNGYTLVGLCQEDMVMLAAGLVTPQIRSMALLTLDDDVLERNAAKPAPKRRGR